MNTIIGVFDEPVAARRAVDALHASSLKLHDVSLLSRADERAKGVGHEGDVSAGQGAAVGAVWGGLVGLAALLIPGVGPFIALGALGAALTGAVTGAVVGGITAALVDFSGIPAEEARAYETMVAEGKVLVAVKARDEDSAEVHRILTASGADSIRDDEVATTGSVNQPVVAMYNERGNRLQEDLDANPFIHSSLIDDTPPPPGLTNDTVYSPTARGIYDTPADADIEAYGTHAPVPGEDEGRPWSGGDTTSDTYDDDLDRRSARGPRNSE
jgi:uncharacterized membrane protein